MNKVNSKLIKKWTQIGFMPVGLNDNSALKLAQTYEFGVQKIKELRTEQPMAYSELLIEHFPFVAYSLRHKINSINDVYQVINSLNEFLMNYSPTSEKKFILDQIKGHFFPLFD